MTKTPEEIEREHCTRVAAEISSTAPVFVQAIIDERAAARAESAAEIAMLKVVGESHNIAVCRMILMEAKLTALREATKRAVSVLRTYNTPAANALNEAHEASK
jgi:hypothetical protein